MNDKQKRSDYVITTVSDIISMINTMTVQQAIMAGIPIFYNGYDFLVLTKDSTKLFKLNTAGFNQELSILDMPFRLTVTKDPDKIVTLNKVNTLVFPYAVIKFNQDTNAIEVELIEDVSSDHDDAPVIAAMMVAQLPSYGCSIAKLKAILDLMLEYRELTVYTKDGQFVFKDKPTQKITLDILSLITRENIEDLNLLELLLQDANILSIICEQHR